MSTNELLKIAREFLGTLRPQDKEFFESSSYSDVLQDVNDVQSQRELTRTMINMKRIHPFLIGMASLENILAAINFSQASNVMACVWGSIRFLLKATNLNDREIDNLLDAYEELGDKIPPLDEYTPFFNRGTESQICLLHIYRDVSTFHQNLYKLFSLRSGLCQKLYKPTWKALSDTTEFLVESLQRHGQIMKRYGSPVQNSPASLNADGEIIFEEPQPHIAQDWDFVSLKLQEYDSEVAKRQKDFDEEQTSKREIMKTRVLEWISASKETESLHKKFQDTKKCPDSGRWLFRRYSEVTDWMKEDLPPESAIWIHGSRGYGKTILASILVDELNQLKNRNHIDPESKVYYFYCQEADADHSTHLGVLKGILYQMVDSNEYLIPYCADRAESGGSTTLAHVQVAQALIEAFFEYNSRQYVVIDGLNECETSKEMREIATFFMRQVSKCDTDFKQGQLRLLFMSQMIPEIEKDHIMPEEDGRIQLKSTDNAEDIRAYVKERIPEFSLPRSTRGGFNLSGADKDQILSIICGRSEEMFLYAHLAIEYLLQQPTKEMLLMKAKGEMLPQKLKDIYEKLLGAVRDELLQLEEGEEHWKLAKLLLGWLVCAKRPLRWNEMQAILSYVPEEQRVDFDNRMLRQAAEKYLGSLVYILDGGHIRIVHSTARRYIVNNAHINAEETQCQLTTLCLRYLCLLTTSNVDQDEEQHLIKVKRGWFAFQDYACSQWHSHVDTVMKACKNLFCGNTHDAQHAEKFGSALQNFIDTHREDLTTDLHSDLARDLPAELRQYSELPFYDNLCSLWNHIYTHQKGAYDNRNTVGIPRIEAALLRNRDALEKLSPQDIAHISDTIGDYYGTNLFKCKRVLCKFFYIGYEKKDDREAHNSRHDRPYQCPIRCNLAPLGFSNKKDWERHVRHYHSHLSEGPSVFEALRSRPGQNGFQCTLCGKEFTRKITQQGHERSHFGIGGYIREDR
ncbi:hypothetical protein TGAM01_v204108 [Trichoderma gamsii]|uniref:C2H2-type domain-containing protein n=1 Tax=Trichoderma gamsii TaxID=398673 RepID=A0A2P4ZS82_9HYPO|nr:hypothetical protein TGAM01_v204108 [Trichoderma gamsii]PON27159.1 hypothetical protein TGAM01_v204108 [Trichoderma gamsii]